MADTVPVTLPDCVTLEVTDTLTDGLTDVERVDEIDKVDVTVSVGEVEMRRVGDDEIVAVPL